MYSEVGYGIIVLDGSGILTPFIRIESSDRYMTKFQIDIKLSINRNFDVELTGTTIAAESNGTGRGLSMNGNPNQ